MKEGRAGFEALNLDLTRRVLEALESGPSPAVLAEAPPGAGKSTLTTSVAHALAISDKKLRIPIVTQTNEQADDLTLSLASKHPGLRIARLTGAGGPSRAVASCPSRTLVSTNKFDDASHSQVIVATARKWQYVRADRDKHQPGFQFEVALIDEAYQMRSDMLLGIAGLYEQLFCVGDPGQLDPFTIVDDSLWKGLWYSPARTAMGTLRAAHPELEPIQLPTSWRLPPSAAGVVAGAFYPTAPFDAGTAASDRSLAVGKASRRGGAAPEVDDALERAAATGWAYLELPERLTIRTDHEVARMLAGLVHHLLKRGATCSDERSPTGRRVAADCLAVITAHNDQVQAVRKALSEAGTDPDTLTVSTANKIQGREYDISFVWHPLAGRRDATAFHLEAGRMCVMLSRHRHACIVVGRAGASRLLAEFPDADPTFLEEPEKFPDGWQANHLVLQHLERCRA